MPARPWLAVATSATIARAAAAGPSDAEIASALDIPPTSFVSASIGESDPRGVAISDGVPIAEPDPDPDGPVFPSAVGTDAARATAAGDPLPFPSRGDTFLVLSTGDASHAMLPPSPNGESTVLAGLDNDQGQDKVQLKLVLAAPENARCLAMDVAFLSEEYPEWVNSSYNDAFTAQLGSGDTWIVDGTVEAPGNFARDSLGNPLTVNTAFDLQASTASTYDGATARLRSATPVLGGREVTVYLTIQDIGDSGVDSAAFIDNVFFSEDALCRFGSSEDSDGDGLLDEWEENGFATTVGGEQWFVDLPAMGADPRTKDVFVEIDFMADATHSHAPDPAAVADIVDSFARSGIHLHVDYGRSAPLTYGAPGAVWGGPQSGRPDPAPRPLRKHRVPQQQLQLARFRHRQARPLRPGARRDLPLQPVGPLHGGAATGEGQLHRALAWGARRRQRLHRQPRYQPSAQPSVRYVHARARTQPWSRSRR